MMRSLMLSIVMVGLVVTGLFFFINTFNLGTDEQYEELKDIFGDEVTQYSTGIALNMTDTLEEGSTEATGFETEEVSMIKSAFKIIKMVLKSPEIVHKVLLKTINLLNLPPFILYFVYSLFGILLAFLVLSVITRIKT
jgi:TRAP-type C4-dicarboxylate transport system permease small subunit